MKPCRGPDATSGLRDDGGGARCGWRWHAPGAPWRPWKRRARNARAVPLRPLFCAAVAAPGRCLGVALYGWMWWERKGGRGGWVGIVGAPAGRVYGGEHAPAHPGRRPPYAKVKTYLGIQPGRPVDHPQARATCTVTSARGGPPKAGAPGGGQGGLVTGPPIGPVTGPVTGPLRCPLLTAPGRTASIGGFLDRGRSHRMQTVLSRASVPEFRETFSWTHTSFSRLG